MLRGARKAGAHAVWVNREGLTNDTEIKADHEITSLADLPPILLDGYFEEGSESLMLR